jgi:hypothetical protein
VDNTRKNENTTKESEIEQKKEIVLTNKASSTTRPWKTQKPKPGHTHL